jgi:isoleucyl-tRNA synthetase
MENTENKTKSERALKEEATLNFWKENKIFKKTLEKEAPKGDFVFYEGPPTANAKPALHHLVARVFKDALPRYKTMRGFRVPRKAGWDTHGLPVELQIEKKLGLKSKKEIEAYGVEQFNKECKDSVFEYIGDWEKFTERIGYWVNFDEAYYTFDNDYISTVWSILANVEKRGLLYKDYKVLPWCPRCGTALSSHELAQGYETVKDLSVYSKFKVVGQENTFVLAWTTTPWTLPGNVALAVGEEIDYVKVKAGGELLILAEARTSILQEGFEVVGKMKGRELLGMGYEPLYPFIRESYKGEGLEKAYKIYAADFVTTTDGTGVVHTAVMYGQDDFVLGNMLGLPKHHTVDDTGHFKPEAGFLAGKFVKDEETAVDIIRDLAHRGLLFKKEKYEHSYPHCWRCKTPLIYYARDSWYIAMSKLRDELVSENQKINWEPAHIKEGRFGEWLREIKDWAISRERYWGTPLPIWSTKDGSKRIVVDSLETLKGYSKKSGNRYFVMRHGGTEGNAKDVISYKNEANDHLTEKGRAEVEKAAEALRDNKIDLIVSSPFARTRETAEIVRSTLGLSEEAVIFDSRIQEMNPGEYDGKSWPSYHHDMAASGADWFTRHLGNSESLLECQKRVGEAVYEIEGKYKGKNILFVTHGGPAWLFYVNTGLFDSNNKTYRPADTHVFVDDFKRFDNAEVRELLFVPLPHDKNFEIDLHRPYIDEVILEKDGEEYRRAKEVMDVWFDSGSMPFAQDPKNILYPADFISEAIDQTRGWFYTLHAIGILMEKGRSFKNVICLGHILDKDGKKMSKSIGNIVNPWEMIDRYGVDALRLWMYSINQPGESKNFDERTVDELQKRVFNLLDNVLSFYELYRDKALEGDERPKAENALDRWILARLSELTSLMTEKLDEYKLLEPVRGYREFVDDLSTWYLRRSRDRIKDGDREAKQTLYHVMKELSKLIAPFAPFYAEELYQKLRTGKDPLSVHLSEWPEEKKSLMEKLMPGKSDTLLEEMQKTRAAVSFALEARSKANVKVRQPLSKLELKESLAAEYLGIIREELNVKEVVVNPNIEGEVRLDTTLTPELLEEGRVRDIVRSIQEWRKEKGLKPGEVVRYDAPEAERELLEKYKEEIKKAASVEF